MTLAPLETDGVANGSGRSSTVMWMGSGMKVTFVPLVWYLWRQVTNTTITKKRFKDENDNIFCNFSWMVVVIAFFVCQQISKIFLISWSKRKTNTKYNAWYNGLWSSSIVPALKCRFQRTCFYSKINILRVDTSSVLFFAYPSFNIVFSFFAPRECTDKASTNHVKKTE
jgi:hypothetical protein